MAKGKGRELGQPIPQDDGIDTICYKITIPNTSEWRVVFRSLVLLLTRGRYWKRTAEGRKITDVQVAGWKIYDSVSLCGDNPVVPDVPESVIIEQVKLKKVRCSMSCCCCGDDQPTLQTNDANNLLPPTVENGLIPDDLPTPTDADYLEWKCKCSKQIVDLLKIAVSDSRNLIALGESNTSDIDEAITGVLSGVDGGGFYVFLWEVWQFVVYTLLHFMTASVAGTIITFLDTNRGAIVEAMYCSTSTQEAKESCKAISDGYSGFNLILKTVMNVWWTVTPWEALYQTSTQRMSAPLYSQVIANYTNDCTCEGSTGGQLPLPDPKYVYVDMLLDFASPVNGGALDNTMNLYEFTGGGNSGQDLTMLPPEYEGATVPNANRAGFAIELLSKDIQQGDDFGHNFINVSTQVSDISFGGGANVWDVAKWFAGSNALFPDLQAWVTTEPDIQWGDDTDQSANGLLAFRFLFYGGSTGDPPISSALFRAYWIVDTTGL